MRIAKDTPKVIIDNLKKVDVAKVSTQRMDELYKAGTLMLSKYPNFTRTLSGVAMIDVDVDDRIPQKFGNLLSQINYGGLNSASKMAAEGMMKKWIKTNLPMRG